MSSTKNRLALASLIGSPEKYDSIVYDNLNTAIEEAYNTNSTVTLQTAIISFYKVLGVADPVLLATGRYLVLENQKIVNSTTNILYFFTYEITNQIITIDIDIEKFKDFCSKYLPAVSLTANPVIINSINVISNIFVKALNELINTNSINTYVYYETNKLLENKTNNEQDGYELETVYNYYLKEFEEIYTRNYDYVFNQPNYYYTEQSLLDTSNTTTTKENIGNREYFVRNATSLQGKLDRGEAIANRGFCIDTNKTPTSLSPTVFPYRSILSFKNKIQSNILNNFLNENDLTSLSIYNYSSATQTSFFNEPLVVEETTTLEVNAENSIYKNVYGQPVEYNISSSTSTLSQSYLPYDKVINFVSSGSSIGFRYEPLTAQSYYSVPTLSRNQFVGQQYIFTFLKHEAVLSDLIENDTYDKVLGLETLSNTTLFYTIKKYQDDVLKQTIVMPKTNPSKILNTFIDTQLIYDKNTTYKVNSVDLIPRLITTYSSSHVGNIITVLQGTSAQPSLYENSLFEKIIKVNDTPPLMPYVEFTTYNNVPNKLTLNFNTTFGTLVEEPISILQNDVEMNKNIYLLQNRTDGKISYGTTDPLKTIQVFISNTKPTSFSSYSSIKPIEVSMNSSYSKSTTFQIQPNTKYYFMFRAVDIHNLTSNPSSIYEVEIVSNNGAIYSIVTTVNFDINKNYDTFKSFKKYINIEPNVKYSYITQKENGSVELGSDNNLWDQKFKVRVTSKKSGKSFDVNVSFTKTELDFT